jgi:hypothetical protein
MTDTINHSSPSSLTTFSRKISLTTKDRIHRTETSKVKWPCSLFAFHRFVWLNNFRIQVHAATPAKMRTAELTHLMLDPWRNKMNFTFFKHQIQRIACEMGAFGLVACCKIAVEGPTI